jgi:hypothetical protein
MVSGGSRRSPRQDEALERLEFLFEGIDMTLQNFDVQVSGLRNFGLLPTLLIGSR